MQPVQRWVLWSHVSATYMHIALRRLESSQLRVRRRMQSVQRWVPWVDVSAMFVRVLFVVLC